MVEIPLQHSNFMAIVDDADFELVNSYKWYLYDYKERTMYAQTNTGLKMHCLLIPEVPEGYVRHHKDLNGLNNQRYNLEIRTNIANLQEKSIYKNNTSGVPGVKKKPTGWEAQIGVMGKRKYLGIYNTFDEAVAARKAAEAKYR